LLKGDKNWLEEGGATEGLCMKLINNHGRIPMPPPYEGIMSNASMGGLGQPRHHILHHTFSSRSFHDAPSNKCKKKGPQTSPIKLVAFTIGAIERRTDAITIQARIQRAGPSISTTGK
jgi:hypothetical protein